MAGDREKTAGEAAKEKAARRADPETAGEQPTVSQPATAGSSQADAEIAAGSEQAQLTEDSEQDLTAGSADAGGAKPSEEEDRSVEELQADVAEAREQLAETVEELSERVDPRPKIEDAKQRAHEAGDTAKQQGPKVAAALGALFLALILIRRRRNR